MNAPRKRGLFPQMHLAHDCNMPTGPNTDTFFNLWPLASNLSSSSSIAEISMTSLVKVPGKDRNKYWQAVQLEMQNSSQPQTFSCLGPYENVHLSYSILFISRLIRALISVLLKIKESTSNPKIDYWQLPNIWNKQLSLSPCVSALRSLRTLTLPRLSLYLYFQNLPLSIYYLITFGQNGQSMASIL